MADLGQHLLAHGRRLDERRGQLRIFVRVVDREHHIVGSQRRNSICQGSVITDARRGDRKVAFDDAGRKFFRRYFLTGVLFPTTINTPEEVWKGLAHMPEDYFQFGITLERSSKDQA